MPLIKTSSIAIYYGSRWSTKVWAVHFDDFETLVALESAHLRNQHMSAENGPWFWTPMGKFVWRRDDRRGLKNFESLAVDSDYLAAGLFGGKTEAAKAAAQAVKDFISKTNLNW